MDQPTPRERQLPVNYEAEQQLLGAILVNNRAYDRVAEFLKPEHFADDRHGRIYGVIERLRDRGGAASPTTLKNYFEQDDSLALIGGVKYLGSLASAAATVINSADHANIIVDCFRRRRMIELAQEMADAAYNFESEDTPEKIAAATATQLDAITSDGGGVESAKTLAQAYDIALERAETAWKSPDHISGLTTSLTKLDAKTGGLQPGDLIVLAGRPSMGKSALAWGILRRNAELYEEGVDDAGAFFVKNGARGVLFSLEMNAEQLAQRDLAAISGVPTAKQRRGDFDMIDMRSMTGQVAGNRHLPVIIDDTANLTLGQIRQRARRYKRQQGIGLIVVDYLQMVTVDSRSERRYENRNTELTAITRGLKGLAVELGVPVVALSQLSRAVEQREDKRPQLSDLRESGSIEQDADVVGLLYRDEYYLEREEPHRRANEREDAFNNRLTIWTQQLEAAKGIAEINVAKQRMGPVGTVRVEFNAPKTRFEDRL